MPESSTCLDHRFHHAWSNGQCVRLDLEENRYSAVAESSALAGKATRNDYVRDVVTDPYSESLPPLWMAVRYGRAAQMAKRMRQASVRDQLRWCRQYVGVRPPHTASTARMSSYVRGYRQMSVLRRRHIACLEDSVCAFVFFNGMVGVRADIVLGVTMQPQFQAHAWVEANGALLNDTRRRIDSYSEILRVTAHP